MPTAVDIFAGAGGISLGLRNAGWDVLAACDNDPKACATYAANHPGTCMVQGDIQSPQTLDALVEATRGRRVDLVAIAAPCQPFSSQNRRRHDGDLRQLLIVQALEVVRRLSPELVLFENVVGLTAKAYRPVIDAVRFELMSMGYLFSGLSIHDATKYGVPQSRRRCIMLAARSQSALDLFEAEQPDFPLQTVRDAIGDLPALASGQSDPHDSMHRARSHSRIALQRLSAIPKDGGSRSALPAGLRMACHVDDRSFPDVYGRMAWDEPSMTLTTGCTDVTKGRYAHPEQDRAITAREAARLQTFPDGYLFVGNGTEISRQIGNAVPPRMIERLAPVLEAALLVQAEEAASPAFASAWFPVTALHSVPQPMKRKTLAAGTKPFPEAERLPAATRISAYRPMLRGPPFEGLLQPTY